MLQVSQNKSIIEEKSFKFVNLSNEIEYMPIRSNSLAYTICQVPVIYSLSDKEDITVITMDGSQETINGHQLNFETSQNIFNRTNLIKALHVSIKK